MAAPAPSRPFVLLNNIVKYQQYYDVRMVECEYESCVAYGCGSLGQKIAEGLTIFADLRGGDDAAPRLAVHVLDEVLHRFEEEVPGELARIYGRVEEADRMMERYGTNAVPCAGIEAVDDEGGVLDSWSSARASSVIASTSISVPTTLSTTERQRRCPCSRTSLRTVGPSTPAALSPCAVTAAAGTRWSSWVDALGRPVVCLWTPTLDDDADLTQGILYCDYADLLDDDARSVEFTFVALPQEYMIEEEEEEEYKHRAMGVGVGDSVWFVVLKSCNHPGDCTVVVLSLDLSDGAGQRRWERHMELSLLSTWTMEGLVEAGLPWRVSCSPFLREQDAGVIYLLVPPPDVNSERGCHLIGIDVRDNSEPRLLPPRHLAFVPIFPDQPVLLSPDFFDPRRNPEGSLSLSQRTTQP
ncbi:unnamed protein product [Alopecurus aequalis]